MSQLWYTYETSTTLANVRTYLNDMFATLRTSFSGTSAPSSPPEGLIFANTNDHLLKICNDGTNWKTMGDYDQTYLGLLPRSGTASYPMTGDLYMGSHQVKGLAEPTATTDAVTKYYVDTTKIDGHYHTGAAGDGNQLTATDLVVDADAGAWQLFQADASDDVVYRYYGVDGTAGSVAVAGSWVDLASATVTCYAGESKIILAGCSAHSVHDGILSYTPQFQILRESTPIAGPSAFGITIGGDVATEDACALSYACTDNEHGGGSITFKLQGKYDSAPPPTQYWKARWITVL